MLKPHQPLQFLAHPEVNGKSYMLIVNKVQKHDWWSFMICACKYLSEYTNSRFGHVHPVNHSAWISHVTSNLVTYVLFSQVERV
jgi:hypothetical protein